MAWSKSSRIITLLVIDTIFFFAELIVGMFIAHSLALVADAFHMLNDILSLCVGLWAVKKANAENTKPEIYTYGFQRAETLGALVNGVFLVALCVTIFLEAIGRFVDPVKVDFPELILAVGAAGLVSNIFGLLLFHDHSHGHGGHGHSHSHAAGAEENGEVQDSNRAPLLGASGADGYGSIPRTDHRSHQHAQPREPGKGSGHSHGDLNMRGIFLHVMGDALGNIGVMITAVFIWKTDFSWKYYTDPAISLIIAIIILCTAVPLCRDASRILLQAVPHGLILDEIKQDIRSLNGVEECHDLHVWQLSDATRVASLHIKVLFDLKDTGSAQYMALAKDINECLHAYGIHASTIQPEGFSPALANQPGCLLNCVDNCANSKGCCGPPQQLDHSHNGHDHGS